MTQRAPGPTNSVDSRSSMIAGPSRLQPVAVVDGNLDHAARLRHPSAAGALAGFSRRATHVQRESGAGAAGAHTPGRDLERDTGRSQPVVNAPVFGLERGSEVARHSHPDL